MELNMFGIRKIVDNACWIIILYAYLLTPLYCYIMYNYVPGSISLIGSAKDLWEIKNNLLGIIELSNA